MGLRYWKGHKFLALLNVLSVALGIAVLVSIQLLNQSSLASFEASLLVVTGKANRQITANGGSFPEWVYSRVAFSQGVKAATPVVQQILPIQDRPGLYLDLLGVDPFSSGPFQMFKPEIESGADPGGTEFFFNRLHVSITAEMAEILDVRPGDSISVLAGNKLVSLEVGGLLRFNEEVPGMNKHLAVMDIANAQEILGKTGVLDRIDLIVENQWEPDFDLPSTAEITTPKQQSNRVHEMLSAFHLNLTALSMIALFVGMFLIYNTISNEVVGRRREIGVLRSLGMTPWQVTILFIFQALMIGMAGIVLGLLAGYGFAHLTLGMVSKTLSSLYLLGSVEKVFVPPSVLVGTAALGMIAVTVAAWKPAREAARMSPVAALHPGWLAFQGKSYVKSSLAFSALIFGLSLFVLYYLKHGGAKWSGFVVAFGFLSGAAFWVAPATWCLCHGLLKWFKPGRGVVRVALSQMMASIKRTGVTMASLACAFAMMMGVSIMIHSFRETIDQWIHQSIRGDIYISPASQLELGPRAFLPGNLESELIEWPEVEAVDTYQEIRIILNDLPVRIGATRLKIARAYSNPEFLYDESEEVWQRLLPAGDLSEKPTMMISEPLSNRLGLMPGQEVAIPTPSGRIRFLVAGVYRDFSSESGVMLMDDSWFETYWDDERNHGVALYLREPTSLEPVMNRIQEQYSSEGQLRLFSNQTLRSQIMEIFDQTFAITTLLRLVAVAVSVLGVFLAMTVLVTERQRYIGILRSIGTTPAQIRQIFLIESGVLGLVGYLVGLAAGILLAWLLVFEINKAFFGWSLDWHWPRFIFLEAPFLAVASSLLAGWIPAWRASRLSVIDCIRDD